MVTINFIREKLRLERLNDDIQVARAELDQLKRERRELLNTLFHPEWGAPVPTPIPITGGPP